MIGRMLLIVCQESHSLQIQKEMMQLFQCLRQWPRKSKQMQQQKIQMKMSLILRLQLQIRQTQTQHQIQTMS